MTPKVQKLRDAIAALKEQIHNIDRGLVPIPKAEAVAALDAYLAKQEANGRNRIASFLNIFVYPQNYGGSGSIFGFDNALKPFNVEEIVSALAPAALRGRLVEMLEQNYANAPETIASSDRDAKLNSLRADLLKLESDDFRESNAAKIPPRRDTDPRVLLGLA